MISHVGIESGRPLDVATLLPTVGAGTIADGDWILAWVFYPNTMTWTFADPSGWTLLRATTGLLFPPRTVELWCREWHTGDPTSWTINMTGFSGGDPDRVMLAVFRGLAAPPTLVSATDESSTSPATAPAITDASIGAADWQFCCWATKGGGFSLGGAIATDEYHGSSPGIAIGWGPILGAGFPIGGAGFAPQQTQPVLGFTSNTFGLQVILPGGDVGGWGVGMVRMGAA